MTWVSLVIYIFSLVSGFSIVFYAVLLFKRYRKKYLSQYLFFLIAYYISGFLNLIGQHLAHEFFYCKPVFVQMVANYLVVLLGLPFFVVSLYFFISFTHEIADRTLSNMFTIWFFIISLVVLVMVLIGINLFIDRQSSRFIKILLNSVNYGIVFFFLLSAFKMFLYSRRIIHQDKKQGLRLFSILYIFLFLGYFAVAQYRISSSIGNLQFAYIVLYYFFLNLIPILYLKYLLKKSFVSQSLSTEEHEKLGRFYFNFDISNQERVIISFILQGIKSHIIAKKLSISTGTVKNHLYNIYRKVGVNSRNKLIQKVRECVQNGKQHYFDS